MLLDGLMGGEDNRNDGAFALFAAGCHDAIMILDNALAKC